MAMTYYHLGNIKIQKRLFLEAEAVLKKGLECSLHSDNPLDAARIYHELAITMELIGRFEEANSYYQKSLEVFKTNEIQDWVMAVLFNLANLWHKSRNRTVITKTATTLGLDDKKVEEIFKAAIAR